MMTYTKNGLHITSMTWTEYQAKKKAQSKKWKEHSDYRLWSNHEKHK